MNGRVYTSRVPAAAVEEHMEVALAGAEHSMPPLVCRWPRTAAPRGFVVFCHGLGASGRDYAGLSRLWASHGYLVIHPTFPDSIATVARNEPTLGLGAADDPGEWMKDERLRAHMHGLLHTPRYWLERIRIVGAVMDRLPTILDATCGQPVATLPGAIAGHSFGAYTAQLLAGATIDLPGKGPRHFRDDRFAAAILLSAQGRDQQGLRDGSWDGISGPMLNVTGTRDGGAGGQDWHWKVEPYHLAPPGRKYLAVIEDGDHYLGGIARPGQSSVPAHREIVEQVTLAFLDLHLAGDEQARTWLDAMARQVVEPLRLFEQK